MNRFKAIRTYLLFILILSGFLITGCGGGETSHWYEKETTKAITAYSLNGVAGTINEPAMTIAVTMPFGTNVTALIATFTTTGTGVKVGTTVQTSTATANDFTS
ncbi:MAG: hypothetical protein NT140_04870, partial [Deltaproteobacteria bacterium]|nr:hypothetical protein [Deltaproteobacteria bacterium]